ncbi:MAG TPA: hypothetical protein ENN84_06340 [Candidatus Marinimicrobia bacterium]|nr:hypothetical protein [Candidatus Neomarinimicrobiota bacterium]
MAEESVNETLCNENTHRLDQAFFSLNKPMNKQESTQLLELLKDKNLRPMLLPRIKESLHFFHRETLIEKITPYIEHNEAICSAILEKLFLIEAQSIINYLRDLAIMNYPFAAPLLQSLKVKYGRDLDASFEAAFNEIAYHKDNRIALFPEILGEE